MGHNLRLGQNSKGLETTFQPEDTSETLEDGNDKTDYGRWQFPFPSSCTNQPEVTK